MKFAISYSFGKDSALSLLKMKKDGHTPACLITTVNEDAERSWFHGIDYRLMEQVSKSLDIPLIKCVCNSDNYHTEFEKCLMQAKTFGAEVCVFGDIDIDGHLDWNSKRCATAGLKCVMPLWKESRETAVYEVIDSGFKAVIKCVQSKYLDNSFLGRTISRKLVEEIWATGADICGENGEYHTFVYDGIIFKKPVNIRLGEIIDFGSHSVIDIKVRITASDLLDRLKNEADFIQRNQLLEKLNNAKRDYGINPSLINRILLYNYETLQEIFSTDYLEETELDENLLENMEKELKDYLDKYLENGPYKDIVRIVSLYLSFIANKPLHPAGVFSEDGKYELVNGKVVCPIKSKEISKPGSLCKYCVSAAL